jgi:NAD(P)-dependent dehydrogenase (short-subunit alcohol dehydrogenase family)
MSKVHGVALVTGGGAGLGRACAMTLGQRGARVAVHYMKSRDGAEEVVSALKAAGAEAESFQGDLTKGADVKALVDAVHARFGGIDILVNNAGDLIERKPLMEMSEEFFHSVIDVNLTSAFLMSKAVGDGESKSNTVAIPGCDSRESVRASRRNRSRPASLRRGPRAPRSSILTATMRSSLPSCAFHTSPMPPAPIRSSSR